MSGPNSVNPVKTRTKNDQVSYSSPPPQPIVIVQPVPFETDDGVKVVSAVGGTIDQGGKGGAAFEIVAIPYPVLPFVGQRSPTLYAEPQGGSPENEVLDAQDGDNAELRAQGAGGIGAGNQAVCILVHVMQEQDLALRPYIELSPRGAVLGALNQGPVVQSSGALTVSFQLPIKPQPPLVHPSKSGPRLQFSFEIGLANVAIAVGQGIRPDLTDEDERNVVAACLGLLHLNGELIGNIVLNPPQL